MNVTTTPASLIRHDGTEWVASINGRMVRAASAEDAEARALRMAEQYLSLAAAIREAEAEERDFARAATLAVFTQQDTK